MTSTSTAKRVLIYTRVSDDRSGDRASVERQEEACRALALSRGWNVVGIESDNSISASSGVERPGWKRVLSAIEDKTVDVVIAWQIDRLLRTMIDLEQLITIAESSGIGIATASGDIDLTTDAGRMVARILAAVARQEVERKAARTRLANAQRASAGKPVTTGYRPFGYTKDGMTVVAAEADAICDGVATILSGGTLAGVAQQWTAAGLHSPGGHGKAWTATGVRITLVRPLNAGISTYDGQEIGVGNWPAIIDVPTRLSLLTLLNDPRRGVGGTTGRRPVNLLTGIAQCSVCGGGVRAGSGEDKARTPLYRCHNGHTTAPRVELDKWVTEAVLFRLNESDALELLTPSGDDTVDTATRDAADARGRLDELADAFADGLVTVSMMVRATEGLQQRLSAAEGILAASTGVPGVGVLVGSDDIRESWAGMTLNARRELVRALVTVKIKPRGRASFVPEDRVEIQWAV